MKKKMLIIGLCLLVTVCRAQSISVSDSLGYVQTKTALNLVSEKLNKGTELISRVALLEQMRKLLMIKTS
jgi:hypothetical protein